MKPASLIAEEHARQMAELRAQAERETREAEERAKARARARARARKVGPGGQG